MASWPKALVQEVAERRCAFVLGAGASAAAKAADGRRHPPSWHELLSGAVDRIPEGIDREAAKQLLNQGKYLDSAQIVIDCVKAPDFAMFLREQFQEPGYGASDIHEIVCRIDPRIVITTNFDDLFESYARTKTGAAYNTCRYYESHILNDIRSANRLLVKAHGCISDPDKVVLSRSQYFEARRRYPSFYCVLDALFLTHTLLFIGCGLNDPDIHLLLENANISAWSSHPHYALVEAGRHGAISRAMQCTYNLELLEYPEGKHEDVAKALGQLEDKVRECLSPKVSGFSEASAGAVDG